MVNIMFILTCKIALYANIIPVNEFLTGVIMGVFDAESGYGFFLNESLEEKDEVDLFDLEDFLTKARIYKNVIWYNK